MTFTFHRGKHRPWPRYWFRWFPFLISPDKITRKVMFTIDSKYYIRNQDQEDHNKLFGICFGWKVHRNSARFGWRYDHHRNVFVLSAYHYINGERYMDDLIDCQANWFYTLHLIIGPSWVQFKVYDEDGVIMKSETVNRGNRKNWGWLLGPYFGGNQTAPSTIILNLKK